uniref:Uncharacterized protein n=1 Tax=Rhizophora mucronata TaxID=61149 RepID=A0A2P2IKM8_RHIMU
MKTFIYQSTLATSRKNPYYCYHVWFIPKLKHLMVHGNCFLSLPMQSISGDYRTPRDCISAQGTIFKYMQCITQASTLGIHIDQGIT